jgi:hypothetical protein
MEFPVESRTSTVPIQTHAGGRLVAINHYFVLGIDPERRTSILAGAAYSMVEAEMQGRERMSNPEMPYTQWKVFVWGEHTQKQVREWLVKWGFNPSHARKVWRDTYGNVMNLIKQAVKEQQQAKPKPLTQEQ